MEMQDRNQYMNEFLERVTYNNICQNAAKIPREIGEVLLKRKQMDRGIIYLDWSMNFNRSLDVKRKGNFGRDEIQMIFNINHDIEWKIESRNQKIDMKKGEVCIYRNIDDVTSMSYPGQQTFLFKSVQIPTDYFRWLLQRYFPRGKIEGLEQLFLHQFTKTKMTPVMYQILYDMDHAECFSEFKDLYLEGKVVELLSLVLHSISYAETEQIKRIRMSEEDCKNIQKIIEQINSEPAKEYNTRELAKSVNMSMTKLASCFSKMCGVPVHTYVIRKRLEYAAALLSQNNCNVSEAAAMAGYTNLSHFSNSFRRQYGVLPKDYKKMLK